MYMQIDTDRHCCLQVSTSPALPNFPEHCHTPVFQLQPLHCADIQDKDVTCVTCAVANWIFSRVRTRQRREKQTAGHNLLHNLIKIIMAFMVLPVSPNLQVGAQQQNRSCKKIASALTRQKQQEVGHKVSQLRNGACPTRSLSACWGLHLQM